VPTGCIAAVLRPRAGGACRPSSQRLKPHSNPDAAISRRCKFVAHTVDCAEYMLPLQA
jgi:hypothetical protein